MSPIAPPTTGRSARRLLLVFAALCALAACTSPRPTDSDLPRAARLEALLSTLAADSMEGRRTGTEGAHRAARFLAAELERTGIEAAGEDGYFQVVPLARIEVEGPNGPRERLVLPSESLDFDTLPPDRVLDTEVNVVGVIRGSDPRVADEVVVVGAHYDHVGIGQAVDGDSIYNGADDDGSGTVAILEIARDLVRGESPRRTVVVLLSTGEETGLLGTRWYIDNPVRPIERTVANLQIEMIGRPDSLAGGFGRGWLTGYERTTMGDQLAAGRHPRAYAVLLRPARRLPPPVGRGGAGRLRPHGRARRRGRRSRALPRRRTDPAVEGGRSGRARRLRRCAAGPAGEARTKHAARVWWPPS